ncbi:hypothetical protein EJ05DRAFT_501186 [Pseudovirgaria hyperparasitica]|uniref:Uncharacterized protein n=1 Tax=Pseudovirgaria hyperparasitica TaxID=470096 RepID=A0A6A6W654_9PEZI|nr:uncharacterized protein EJ05DRAFT_501186 [Pseudovirgaria hyperparasitica]KAF2757659.1 hypothetical protein EJ05DRAFT_501186 [Pseudovirgaria hyperparasitica]
MTKRLVFPIWFSHYQQEANITSSQPLPLGLRQASDDSIPSIWRLNLSLACSEGGLSSISPSLSVLVLLPDTTGGTVRSGAPAHLIDNVKTRFMLIIDTGFHIPIVRKRDAYYNKLEEERNAGIGR